MLYELAHWLQAKCPWMWEAVEELNAVACGVKIGEKRKLQEVLPNGVRLADLNDAGRTSLPDSPKRVIDGFVRMRLTRRRCVVC